MEKQSSLVKTFHILEILAEERALGISHVTARTGYPAATVHRILNTLAEMGYVHQNTEDRKYLLGLNILKLARSLVDDLDIVSVSRPIMRTLMQETRETVNLVVFDRDEAVYVEQVNDSRSMLRMFTKVGARVPLYCTGVGKTYLAGMNEADFQAYLHRVDMTPLTARTLVREEDLRQELEEVRRQGYARDKEEVEEGVACVSAAIFHRGLVIGGLSISGPSTRISDRTAPVLGPKVQEAAALISAHLDELNNPVLFG